MSSTAALRVFRIQEQATAPEYATEGAAGLDLRAALDKAITLAPGQFGTIPTGLAMALPPGYEGQVRPRSGLAARHGVTVLNAPGTIDEDYRGEVAVVLINHGPQPFVVEPGARIAQLIVSPVTRVTVLEVESAEKLGDTVRGEGGFGSTGV